MSSDFKVTKILLPIDGSEGSFKAAGYAIKMAKESTADEIRCVHVIGAAPYFIDRKPILPETYYAQIQTLAEHWFDRIKEMAVKNQIGDRIAKSEVRIVGTSIPDAILDYAEEMAADLIVLGTRGRTGVKRFLLGSVAEGVVHHAKCPVLVVR